MMILAHEGCLGAWQTSFRDTDVPDCMVRIAKADEPTSRVVESFALKLSPDPDAKWSTVSIQPISLLHHHSRDEEEADASQEKGKSADFVTTRYTVSRECVDAIRAPRGSTETRVSDDAAKVAYSIASDMGRLRENAERIVGGRSQPVFTVSGDFNPSASTHVNVSVTGMNVNAFSGKDFEVSNETPGKVQTLMQTMQSTKTFVYGEDRRRDGEEEDGASVAMVPESACRVYNTAMYMGVCQGGMRAELQKLSSMLGAGCPSSRTPSDDELLNAYIGKVHPPSTTMGDDELRRLGTTPEFKEFAAACKSLSVINQAASRYSTFASEAPECKLETFASSTNGCVQRIDRDVYTKDDYACMVDFAVQRVTEKGSCLEEYMHVYIYDRETDVVERRKKAQDAQSVCELLSRDRIIEDLASSRGERCRVIIEKELEES